ncbi:MAG: hypothetical protein QOJ53_2071 [Sphingomonadales bacterium]|nr:hypothetical protein [Sphingomonadales bacterium]MEA3042488.1 hypothetical protein [Sphingomonadales bacterium]MEA3047739.1 hypothetical protein [Sphingomonadales bacterium]
MPSSMADERALAAIRRIEQALARIEAASARPRPAPAADPDDLRQLRDVHQALRARVEGAIGQIDQLLEAEAR